MDDSENKSEIVILEMKFQKGLGCRRAQESKLLVQYTSDEDRWKCD